MKNTETHFGLSNVNGKISSDGGNTFLPKYSEMSTSDFDALVRDTEYYLEVETLSDQEISDLKEILE